MQKSELKPHYSIFGNKGNVWNNECHIAKGSEPTTLCGVPMLSSNWARIEDVQEIGCKECLSIYNGGEDVPVMGDLDAQGNTCEVEQDNYYVKQLNKLQPAVDDVYGISVKFTSNVNGADTNYFKLNDESASAIVEFLSNNYTLTLK